ncbi:porin [Thiomicrorhabdus sediminis]|uniref:Porin n=1 Tax=Thiomicrorhabdus sediminis TaxID=2580412 RepID=A0A4P9K8Z1_9GAMM|nr:porin [Thiomicrorhabdus sediminis]QCU90787.1 porin [Thiomicrorhabdus sediminis]
MKKNIVALAVAAAISAPAAMADAPTVYGQLNVGAEFATGSDMNVKSIASRLGIKGSEDLGNGLKAVYKVEFGLATVADNASQSVSVNGTVTDTGSTNPETVTSTGSTTGQTLTSRNMYAGLAGGFGTVVLGRHDTPEKMSQASDLFNDGNADLGNGKMDGGIQVNETRSGNVIAYMSPSFSGVKIVAAQIATGNSANDAVSASISYGSKKKGLYLAAAMTDFKQAGSNDTTRLSAQYKAAGLTANVIYIDSKDSTAGNTASEGTVTQFNLGYKMGKFMPKVKVSTADSKTASSVTNVAYGLNYSLGKKTTAYIEMVDADKNNAASSTDATFVGLLHKF